MNDQKQFYEGRHATRKYGGATYHMGALLGLPAMRAWLDTARGRPIKMLDVGLGKGTFLRDLLVCTRAQWNLQPAEVVGVDIVRSPDDLFAEIAKNFRFIQMSVDGQTLPFPDAQFDFVCSNHVLEHVFETEKLVREFRRVLKPDGLCIISVPNAACWYNRVMFLFGGQPVSTEVGTEKSTYGIWPRFLQKQAETWQPSGHIRDFTPRGFEDLVRALRL